MVQTRFHVASHPIQYQVGGSRKGDVVFLLRTGGKVKRYETLATSISRHQTQDPDYSKEFTPRQRIQFDGKARGLMQFL